MMGDEIILQKLSKSTIMFYIGWRDSMETRINIVRQTQNEIRLNLGLMTMNEAAKKIGVSLIKFRNAIQRRPDCPRPETYLGNGRRGYYVAGDLPKLIAYFEKLK